jgi:type II secretory ATPase GspE/PulE/Tfp pilus assembly ATPase PilB-like protein
MPFDIEKIDLAQIQFTAQLLRCIPAATARLYHVMPVSEGRGFLSIASADAYDARVIDDLSFVLNRELEIRLADRQQIAEYIQRYYGSNDDDNLQGETKA